MTDAELLMALEEKCELTAWTVAADRICNAINTLPVKTAKAMAHATATALKALAVEWGYSASEIVEREPHDPRCYFDNGDCFVVAWESGPYEWGYHTSMAIGERCGKLVEPYYSFDLCFHPGEDSE